MPVVDRHYIYRISIKKKTDEDINFGTCNTDLTIKESAINDVLTNPEQESVLITGLTTLEATMVDKC